MASARIRCASRLGCSLMPRSRRHGQVAARACSVQGGVDVWQVHGYDVPRELGCSLMPRSRRHDRRPQERVPFKAVWTCGKCTDTMCLEIGMLVGATFKTAQDGGRQSVFRSRRCGRVASARIRCASKLGCSLVPPSRRHGQVADRACSVQGGVAVWQVHGCEVPRNWDARWCHVQDGTDRWPPERVPFKAVWTCGKCTDTMCLEIGMLVDATFKTARTGGRQSVFRSKAVWTCGKCTDTMFLETGMLVGATFKTARTGGRQSVFRSRRCGRVASARIRCASRLGCSLVPRSRRHGQVAARACSVQGSVDVWQMHGYDVPRDWDARWCHVQDGTDKWPPERVPFKAVWTCGKCTDTMCLEIGMLVGATFKTARTSGRQSVFRSRRCGRVASARIRCASRLGCSLVPRSRRHGQVAARACSVQGGVDVWQVHGYDVPRDWDARWCHVQDGTDRWPPERVPFKAVWTCGKCTDTMCLETGMLVGATFKTARTGGRQSVFRPKSVWTCGKCTDTMFLETGMLVGATFKTARTGGRQSVFRSRRCGRVASARIRCASRLGCSLMPRSRRHGQVAARACSVQGGVDVWQVHGYDVPRDWDARWCHVQDGTDRWPPERVPFKAVWTCGKCTDTMCLEIGMLVGATFKTARTGGRQSVFRSRRCGRVASARIRCSSRLGCSLVPRLRRHEQVAARAFSVQNRCGRVASARIGCASRLGCSLMPRSRRHGQVAARACSVQGGVDVWQVHGYDVPRDWDARWCHVQDGTDRWPTERVPSKAVWTCGKCTDTMCLDD